MHRRLLDAAVALLLAGAGTPAAAAPGSADAAWAFSGHAKSLLVDSRTALGEPYTLSLNRLRVALLGRPVAGLTLDLQLDQEVLLGSLLGTTAFRATKDVRPPQYWRADANPLDRNDVYWRAGLYRGAATWTHGKLDIRLGRQRIAWGTGRLWSPLDVMNPAAALALERDERLGVDAALVEYRPGPLSRVSAVYAPAPGRGAPSQAVRVHGNAAGVDASLVLGRMQRSMLLGVDLAGQLGLSGLRAEVARLKPDGGRPFVRALLGVDHGFTSGLTVGGELYFNGGGASDPARHAPAVNVPGPPSPARRYAGIYASHDLTPLLRGTVHGAANLDDGSLGIDLRLAWSWRPDVELTAGLQHFSGAANSEFGRMGRVVFVQAQWYF